MRCVAASIRRPRFIDRALAAGLADWALLQIVENGP